MRALWLEDRRLSLRSVAIPEPPQGEALVRVVQAGICNTDIELTRGYYPYSGILGHEFVGLVEGGPLKLRGKRVVGEINAVCGDCDACRHGRPTHCENRTVLGIVNRDGAFAEYLTLPVENLHVVPDDLSTDAATFTEPLAAALEIQEQINVGSGDRVVVIGDGKLGLLVAMSLQLTACSVTAVGRHEGKLAVLDVMGIETHHSEDRLSGEFDIAVECTGNPDGFAAALDLVRPRGTVVMKSTYADHLTFDAAKVVVDEINLIGSRCGPFAPALELLAKGKIEVERLISARYPLDDALEAIDRAQQPGVLKVLLDVAANTQ